MTWLNRAVVGTGATSFLSDFSHEVATSALPGLVAGMGAGAGTLGLIEGVADGLSAAAKVAGGGLADRLRRRKPFALGGYVVTAVATAAIAWAHSVAALLLCRGAAWTGRGLRTPPRKVLLAEAVPPEAYGRAFGLERAMDTLGAIVGPAVAAVMIASIGVRPTIAWTIVPGLAAVLAYAFLVREAPRAMPPPSSSSRHLLASYRDLPAPMRPFLVAVGVFGCGDYARSLLILLAVDRLAPSLGLLGAASAGTSLYLLHNVVYAAAAYLAGHLGDRVSRSAVLAAGYALGAAGAGVAAFAGSLPALAVAFAAAGATVGIEEAMEDAVAAERATQATRGAAFGALAAVNGAGDLVASTGLGALWAAFGAKAAFLSSAGVCLAGAILAARLVRVTPRSVRRGSGTAPARSRAGGRRSRRAGRSRS